MDDRPKDTAASPQVIVRADEVDHIGTAIPVHIKTLLGDSILSQTDPPASVAPRPSQNKNASAPLSRPTLRREASAPPPPPPPSQPPPPAPMQQSNPDAATDSLSLPQLKHLVSQFPKVEQRAYAFQYADAQGFVDEISEWFHYTEQDRIMLLSSRESFERRWRAFCESRRQSTDDEPSWLDVDQTYRKAFLAGTLSNFGSSDEHVRLESLESLLYVLSGVWGLTSGLERHPSQTDSPVEDDHTSHFSSYQIEWMHEGADLFLELSGVKMLYKLTKEFFAKDRNAAKPMFTQSGSGPEDRSFEDEKSRAVATLLTSWYMIIESARFRPASEAGIALRNSLNAITPTFLIFLVEIIARLRWDESSTIPLTRLLTLFWKTLLVMFGDTKTDLEHAKNVLQPRIDPFSADASHPVLTASPLDYHLFRQEITSKYPAYNPPLPLVPFESEHKSMLPPLPHHTSGSNTVSSSISGFGVADVNGGGSILHQPVHIATPAPSPPPSPAGPGGKAGKKQNYQTNQNFPFLYPPLDGTSNNIGGKGSTEFQDMWVGKKWEGSDIPTSIIEAGRLFASRMRMTRAMRQLWKERELFLQDDRGWNGTEPFEPFLLDYDEEKKAETVSFGDPKSERKEDEEIEDNDLKGRLGTVEDFYHHAMPNLQSLVIVMMKTLLRNIQDIALENGSLMDNGQPNGLPRSKSNVNVAQATPAPVPPAPPQASDLSVDELGRVRLREIDHKAISGSILVLLKWFKLSHVLKFEYLSQLLLDSNYIPLALKYFALQNVEDLVAIRYDRDNLGFFHFCHLHSDHPPLSPTSLHLDSDQSSSDEAVPPPILRHRRSPNLNSESAPAYNVFQGQNEDANRDTISESHSLQHPRPSVDELGNPLAPLPPSPITSFSFRQFQTSIHLLRILQKLTRAKAHRILLLVQYKSSQILRRILRIPDPMLRLYVLKLFKSQVPYCGRKWRQSNMRVITAIYLHCRPELRDEWLAGMHDSGVEGEVDDAVPLEWALRGLTYWWQKRMYSDVMKPGSIDNGEAEAEGQAGGDENRVKELIGGGQEIDDEERDFFQRELDNMGWGMAGLAMGDEIGFGEEAPGSHNGVHGGGGGGGGPGAGGGGGGGGEHWEQGGPLQMEAW